MSWASSLLAMLPRPPNKALSMLVSNCIIQDTAISVLTPKQKNHTSSHLRLLGVLQSASQRRPKPPHQHMAGLQPNETRSMRPRSQRQRATTSAAPFKSNTLLPSRRHSVVRRHRRLMPHQRPVPLNAFLLSRRVDLWTATSLLRVRDHHARQEALPKLVQVVSLRDQCPTILRLAPCLRQRHDRRQAARCHKVRPCRKCHREATRTRNRQQQLSLPPTPKVASRSPRARITPSLRLTPNRSLLLWANQVLFRSQALSACSQFRWDPLVDILRTATSGLTPSPRPLAA